MNNDINSIGVWCGVNKNGTLMLFTEKPVKDENKGKWIGKQYVNIKIYNMIKDLFTKANYSWNNEAEYIEFSTKN